MMQRPWDCAQPDEWLPRSLRLCWGSGDGGGGFGDSGGGFGGGFTGGGDWGSSGSFDASGFNAGGDVSGMGGFAGVPGIDASVPGTTGGGDWGSFGTTSYSGLNAPNAIFSDIAGPNPGVTTGGGDWGSAGAFSAAGMGGGPGGGLWGGDIGGGGGFYGGGGGGGGGPFGAYGGGGGGGGGGGRGGGGSFSGGGGRASVTDSTPGYVGSVSGGRDVTPASPAVTPGTLSNPYGDDTGPAGRGEQDTVGPAPAPEADFGKPAAPEAAPEAAPSESRSAPSESRSAPSESRPATSEPEAEPSSFGPQSVAGREALQTLSDLTQSALQADPYAGPFAGPDVVGARGDPSADRGLQEAMPGWFESLTQDTTRDDPSTLPSILSNWLSNIQNAPVHTPANPITNPWTAPVHTPTAVNPITNAWNAPVTTPDVSNINTWLSPTNQNETNTAIFNAIVNALSPVNETSSMGRQGTPQDTTPWGSVFEGAAPPAQDLATQLGTEDITSAPTQDTTPWGSVFEGAAPPAQDLATQLGTQDIDTTNWGSVFEAPEQAPDYASVFEGAAPAIDDIEAAFPGISAFIPGGRETDFTGYESLPGGQISAFIPGGRETNFDYGPTATAQPAPASQPSVDALPGGQPGAPPPTDDASTKGGDPALSGLSADAAAAAAAAAPGQAQEGGGRSQSQGITLGQLQDAVYGTGGPYITPGGNVYGGHTIADIQAAVYGGSPPGMPTGNPNADLSDETSQPTQAPPPSLIEQAQPGVPMPSPRPVEAPQQPGVPMPQARPADAPSFGPPAKANTAAGPGMQGVVPAHTTGGQTRTTAPVAIIVHRTESGPNYGIGNLKNQMQGGGAGYSYAVGRDPNDPDKAVVYELRDPSKTAGHMQANTAKGYRSAFRSQGALSNRNTIGVSFIADTDEDITPAMKESMQQLVEGLGKNNNIPPSRVYGHGQVNPGHRQAAEGRNIVNWAQAKGGNWGTTQIAQPRPPADIPPPAEVPVALPPQEVAPVPRPPADIPAPAPKGPNEFDIPVTPPVRNATVIANNILKQATAHLNKDSGEAAFQAASVVAAKALAAAGISAAMARSLMIKGALDGAIANGYGPGGPNSTVMGFSIWGKVQSAITDGVNAALQGYVPAKPGELQGPPAPAAPGKQGALPFGQQYADLSQSLGSVAGRSAANTGSVTGRPGDIGAQQPMFSIPGLERLSPTFSIPGLEQLSPLIAPPDPSPTWGQPPAPPPPPLYKPGDPGMFNPFRGNEAALPGGLLHLAAGGRDAGQPPAVEQADMPELPGRAEWETPLPGGLGNIDPYAGHADPLSEKVFDADSRTPVIDPDVFQWGQREQQEYQQNLDPRGWQQATLDFLQNFNPISTAEARGGRSQAGNLQAPRADPGTIQSRLSEARFSIINELQTNQGLRNTLDLIVTGEVGSQGKAAVLAFLETAMNKAAAEASREGRAPTGRDLLQYLNNRSYFPDTWGKIESGKVKGGALTDDLLAAVAGGSNTTKGSTGNSSATSPGSRFGGNPTNATIGKEHYGVENYGHHAAWYNALGALQDMPAVGFVPMPAPAPAELRGLAKGGHVAKDERVVVGEEGPEYFVPDEPGTVLPHMPQARRPRGDIDRWPKLPAPDYPGRYGGVEREILRQTRAAQDPSPGLMDMVDSGRLRLTPNWHAMLNDPALIALGRSRMDDRREGIDPGAEQYGTFIPAPAPAAEPPDPTSPMAQALGYGSIRRPMRIGRQSYTRE